MAFYAKAVSPEIRRLFPSCWDLAFASLLRLPPKTNRIFVIFADFDKAT
jgi:hypothetical protein